MKHVILAAAVALALTRPAAAIDENGEYTILRTHSCEDWNSAKTNDIHFAGNLAYLAGYFSAMNQYLRGKENWLDKVGIEMAMQATFKYCEDRPDWTAADAIKHLAQKLKDGKLLFQ